MASQHETIRLSDDIRALVKTYHKAHPELSRSKAIQALIRMGFRASEHAADPALSEGLDRLRSIRGRLED